MKTNKYIKVIQTKKYKDINLYLRFTLENKNNIIPCVCLLSKMVGEVSKKYPTKQDMTACRDMLYGMGVDCSYKTYGNLVSFCVHYSFINPRFVDVSINQYNEFIKETLYNSIIDENTLAEAKTTITASLLRKKDKPQDLATQRFIEIVSKDNKNFDIYSTGDKFIKCLNKIELDEIKDTYKHIVNKAQLNIYLCGELNDNDINTLCTFRFDNRNSVNLMYRKVKYNKKRMIVDKKDISQSYLSIVYSTPYSDKHKDYFAWYMGNCLLGLGPTSLLFTEIREKLSLCYAISSRLYKNEGLVRISTSIDGKNVDLAIKKICEQVERLKNKDYEIRVLDNTKAYICNALMSTYDQLDSLVDYYYNCDVTGFNYTLEEYCENIRKVNSNDIAKVFKKYNPYFNYLLLGNSHE